MPHTAKRTIRAGHRLRIITHLSFQMLRSPDSSNLRLRIATFLQIFLFFLRIQESRSQNPRIQESKNPRIQESRVQNPRIQKPISLTRVQNPKLRIQNSRLPESRIQIQESKILAYQSPRSQESKNPRIQRVIYLLKYCDVR